jgi:toxin ParE1/3/4
VRVLWTVPARSDLREAFDYIQARNPRAAGAFLARIESSVGSLADQPRRGRPGRVAGTRELIVTGAPYIVPYRIIGETIQVLRVWHTARRWPEAF